MSDIITVKNLEKNYGSKKAVGGINFTLKKGEVLGLLGPNGAGKSTTLNILSTILKADNGDIDILGKNLKAASKLIKKSIGIVPQDIAIYEEISAEKNVSFFASLYGFKGDALKIQVKEALELVGLYDKRADKPKTFSGGMKRRLNIACAIAHKPKVIIMDEPTVGIDPQSRNHILESIKTLRERGSSIIYSTHYMEEVEAIADRIIIMNEGKIIAEGTNEELKQKVNDKITYYFKLNNTEKLIDKEFYDLQGIKKVEIYEDGVNITSLKSIDNLNEIITVFIKSSCKIASMNTKEASLETIFLELTGKNLRD
jgi:ABC-type multidrug transport system, ATPase component